MRFEMHFDLWRNLGEVFLSIFDLKSFKKRKMLYLKAILNAPEIKISPIVAKISLKIRILCIVARNKSKDHNKSIQANGIHAKHQV
jgi:hypothetical protein